MRNLENSLKKPENDGVRNSDRGDVVIAEVVLRRLYSKVIHPVRHEMIGASNSDGTM